MKAYFLYSKDKDRELFIRAKKEILIINGDIPRASQEYISLGDEEHFEETLAAQNEEEFCLYTLYKIVHFLEIVAGVRVLKMAGEFARDDAGFYWLINLHSVKHANCMVSTREELQIKNVDKILQEENSKLTSELDIYYRSIERREAVKVLNQVMKQHYNEQKKRVGLDNYVENYFNDDISDDLFAKIHPDAPFKLSSLLKTKANYEEIRVFLLKHVNRMQSERLVREGVLVTSRAQDTQSLLQSRVEGMANTSHHRPLRADMSLRIGARKQGTVSPIGHASARGTAKTTRLPQSPRMTSRESYRQYDQVAQQLQASQQKEPRISSGHGFFKTIRYANGKKNLHVDNQLEYLR